MNIGEKIHQIRKMSGMTQEELAEKMNVSRQTISKWENGTAAPDLENAVLLCELFQISLDDFLKGERKPVDREERISLQDIVKINSRLQRMTIMLVSGLFFLMVGGLVAFFIGALFSTTTSLEYTLYRYIAVGEYDNMPLNYWKMVSPAIVLIVVGAALCANFIREKWREKKHEQ